MSETKENKQHKKCAPERALFSLLPNYSKEDIDLCFTDLERTFYEWLGTYHADERSKRESVAYSMEIFKKLEATIRAIPQSKIIKLKEELLSSKHKQ